MLLAVHSEQFGPRCRTRLAHGAPLPLPLGSKRLHHLGALDPFRMSWRSEMFGKGGRRDQNQGHLHHVSDRSAAVRFSSDSSAVSTSSRFASMAASSASAGTSIGDPTASATVLKGLG